MLFDNNNNHIDNNIVLTRNAGLVSVNDVPEVHLWSVVL